MKQKHKLSIFLFLFLISFVKSFAQDFHLNIISKNTIENSVLKDVQYQKIHKDTLSLNFELTRISNYLKNIGYFLNTIKRVERDNHNLIAYFSLDKKTTTVFIKINTDKAYLFKNRTLHNSSFSIPIYSLKITLSNISKKLDAQGKSFSKVQLNNIKIRNDTLFSTLSIYESKKRIINQVIVKGYTSFPKSYIKNYFEINASSIFNQNKISQISTLSKNIPFIKEIKPPEVLFTKDSTQLFLYLKKQTNNSIDGIVSFTSEENGKLLFNGIIDLKLNNILNIGEKFDLYWNRIAEERQEFKISSKLPYIFNSKISPELSFSLYRQDSSFLNVKFNSKLFYLISPKINAALTYTAESSENLINAINEDIDTFSNYFLGVQLQYIIPKNDFFFNNIFKVEVNPTFGNRKTNASSSNQFKIESTISYLWNVTDRNNVFLKNNTGYLKSDSFLNNELFRIGGANSIRGFDEQSIFTSNYSYFNVEYQFLTSQTSYIYTITDIGFIDTASKKDTFIGLGFGYLFTTNNSRIKLSTAIGSNSSQSFNIKNSKLILNWINYF